MLYDGIPSLSQPIFYQTLPDDDRKNIIERYPVVKDVKYTPPATIPEAQRDKGQYREATILRHDNTWLRQSYAI